MPNTLLWAAGFCLEAPRIPLSSTYCFPCAISWGDEMAVAEASWVTERGVGWWWWWWWKLVVEWLLPSTLVPLVRCNGAGSSGYGDSEGEGKLGSCVILCPACVVDTTHSTGPCLKDALFQRNHSSMCADSSHVVMLTCKNVAQMPAL